MKPASALALLAFCSLSSFLYAGDLFDGPGRGYREQKEKGTPFLSHRRITDDSFRIEIDKPMRGTPQLFDTHDKFPAFKEPRWYSGDLSSPLSDKAKGKRKPRYHAE
jgi:hypothetical protein